MIVFCFFLSYHLHPSPFPLAIIILCSLYHSVLTVILVSYHSSILFFLPIFIASAAFNNTIWEISSKRRRKSVGNNITNSHYSCSCCGKKDFPCLFFVLYHTILFHVLRSHTSIMHRTLNIFIWMTERDVT